MTMEIRTDNKWHDFKYWNEVPRDILRDQFDWLDYDNAHDGFFKYRGHWYHMTEFMNAPKDLLAKGWHGYAADSYFSGVLIEYSPDGEQYRVGTYFQ